MKDESSIWRMNAKKSEGIFCTNCEGIQFYQQKIFD